MVTSSSRESSLQAFAARINAALDHADVPPKGKGRQVEVSKMFGVSQKGARKWLEGETFPEHSRLELIAKKLGVSFNWLATGGGSMTPEPIDFASKEVATKFVRATKGHVQSVADAIREFVNDSLPEHATADERSDASVQLYETLADYYPDWIKAVDEGRDPPRYLASQRDPVVVDAVAEMHATAGVFPARQIPVVSYVEAGAPCEIVDAYAPGDGHRRIWLDPDAAERFGPYAFALEVRGRSMEPDYLEGEIIVVDPDQDVRPGDVVVAKVNGDREATVKKYRDRGRDANDHPIYELIPINADYATILIDTSNPGTLIGPVVEHRRDPRR